MKEKISESEESSLDPKEAIKIVEKMWEEPLPDYSSDSYSDDSETEMDIRRMMSTGSRFRVSVGRKGILGASSRYLDETDPGMTADVRRDLKRSAKQYIGEIRKGSRFDRAPDRADLQRVLQDGYLKRKDNKYKDRALPPIKEKKFCLGPGKEDLVSHIRERNMGSWIGIDESRQKPLIPDTEVDDIYDTIQIPRKGTVSRDIGKKMSIMLRERRHLNGRPRSVEFNVTDSGRPGPSTYAVSMKTTYVGVTRKDSTCHDRKSCLFAQINDSFHVSN